MRAIYNIRELDKNKELTINDFRQYYDTALTLEADNCVNSIDLVCIVRRQR
jgi:hypothetical protein